MDFQEILTLIEKVSNSSLTSFSFVKNQDGIQISMEKEKKAVEMYRVNPNENEADERWIEKPQETEQSGEIENSEEFENNTLDCQEKEFLAPKEGIFSYSEDGRFLLRIGKELKNGVEIGSIIEDDGMPYNLSVKCLGEVTGICVEDGQRVKVGDSLFIAKVEQGTTEFEVL